MGPHRVDTNSQKKSQKAWEKSAQQGCTQAPRQAPSSVPKAGQLGTLRTPSLHTRTPASTTHAMSRAPCTSRPTCLVHPVRLRTMSLARSVCECLCPYTPSLSQPGPVPKSSQLGRARLAWSARLSRILPRTFWGPRHDFDHFFLSSRKWIFYRVHC